MSVGAESALELLQRHTNGELDRSAVVDELAAADPRFGMLARLLAGTSDRPGTTDSAVEDGEIEARLDAAMGVAEDARRLADAVRVQFDEVVEEIGGLRSRLDDLAAALGACPGCWGEDPVCGWCRGRGAPGAMTPDANAFDRLVMPAVQIKVGMRRRGRPEAQAEGDERRTA